VYCLLRIADVGFAVQIEARVQYTSPSGVCLVVLQNAPVTRVRARFKNLWPCSEVRLMNRGFGELTLAAHIAYVVPSVAFLLQAGENHRLLTILLFPLTALALAFFLILNFTTFTADQKYHRATLLRSLTWERAVPFHHNLIIFAYFIFAISPLFGFSFSVIWPAFLTLPFAILQILLLRHISMGGKPNWPLLTVTALAVFGLTTYFLTLTFWLR